MLKWQHELETDPSAKASLTDAMQNLLTESKCFAVLPEVPPMGQPDAEDDSN